jgi:hypothetical protein
MDLPVQQATNILCNKSGVKNISHRGQRRWRVSRDRPGTWDHPLYPARKAVVKIQVA